MGNKNYLNTKLEELKNSKPKFKLHFDNKLKNRKEKDISILFKEMSNNDNGLIIITGNNGSGKSHVKTLMLDKSFYKYWKRQPYSYCSEKDNLRTKQTDHGGAMAYRQFYISRGQTTLIDISEITTFENANILLDEPEAGISLSNYKLPHKLLLDASKVSKIYCFTNNPYLCLMADKIYKVNKVKVTLANSLKFKLDIKNTLLKTTKLFYKD